MMKRILTSICAAGIFSSAYSHNPEYIYKNSVSLGLGGESSVLGIDYARCAFRSSLFIGFGAGMAGFHTYIKYETPDWKGIAPFISAGISYAFAGTVSFSENSCVFYGNAGVVCRPFPGWRCVPQVSLGITYYSLLSGKAEGGLGNFGPLVKAGIAFPKTEKQKPTII